MARVREMQGVPAHLEYLKRNDEEQKKRRRNIAHCIYSKHIEKRIYICTCKESPNFNVECHNSRNCSIYKEKDND